jgi:hypothetical protein
MASDDRPKLPRVTLGDERLYVEGEKEPYFRNPEHTILMCVEAFTISRSYQQDRIDGVKRENWYHSDSLKGIAKLEGRDRFAVIGLETGPNPPITFGLEPVPDADAGLHWRGSIWFFTRDLSSVDEDQFYVNAVCPKTHFDELLAAIERGHIDHIRVAMETNMWTRGFSGLWHLAPPKYREDRESPDFEIVTISSVTMVEKFGHRPANKSKDDLHLTEKTKDEIAVPKPLLVELPTRVYSMLTALLAIAAALLMLTLLRH